jgi:hypothetical protein
MSPRTLTNLIYKVEIVNQDKPVLVYGVFEQYEDALKAKRDADEIACCDPEKEFRSRIVEVPLYKSYAEFAGKENADV